MTRLFDLATLRDASAPKYDVLLIEWTEAVGVFATAYARETRLWQAIRRSPSPAVILLDLRADPFPPLLECGLGGAAGVLLKGVHDVRPEHFARRLREVSHYHRVVQLMPTVAARTESAGEPIRRTLASLIRNPAAFEKVSHLALATCCTTRTLERQYQTLGISSPRTLLACVRLAHLHVRDRDGAASTDAIARTVGFRDACSMLSAVRNIAGCGTMAEFLALSPMRLSRCLEAALRADPRPDF